LVVRNEEILTPAEADPVRAGDYVYLLAPPEKAQALDRFFVNMPPPASPDPRLLGDFFVSGDVTLGALAEIYGLQVAADHMELALADFFTEQLRRPAKTGNIVQLGPIALLAHKVANGRVTTVGLRLAEPEEAAGFVRRPKAWGTRLAKSRLYMPLKAQTAKFERAKKASEHGTMTAAVAAMPGQRRDTMPTRAGSEIATVTMREMRQSSGPSAK